MLLVRQEWDLHSAVGHHLYLCESVLAMLVRRGTYSKQKANEEGVSGVLMVLNSCSEGVAATCWRRNCTRPVPTAASYRGRNRVARIALCLTTQLQRRQWASTKSK